MKNKAISSGAAKEIKEPRMAKIKRLTQFNTPGMKKFCAAAEWQVGIQQFRFSFISKTFYIANKFVYRWHFVFSSNTPLPFFENSPEFQIGFASGNFKCVLP